MSRKRAVVLGAIAFVCLVVAVFGSIWLSEIPIWHREYRIRLRFENMALLERGNRVYYMGINVGRVTDLRILHNGTIGAVAEVALPKDVLVPVDSRVWLVSGLLERYINVYPGQSQELLPPDGEIRGITLDIYESFFQTTTVVESLFTPANVHNYGVAIRELSGTMGQFHAAMRENRDYLRGVLANTEDLVSKLNRVLASERLDRLAVRGDSLITDLSRIMNRIDQGQGTMGRLVTEDTLYTQLNTATAGLGRLAKRMDAFVIKADTLISEIRKNPGKFVKFSVF